ncbi:LeuA family protein [Promethearchaeum syntrophicum]|uniref:LeuA family protein n=1 Tax=Promethearchaeum syntrophicum TaxID=2594042 RepID=A0A5B9D5L6_9ARCH|nr:homoaconitate hydratase [Candidatus Prometheoarchaeum syntrophicum]QEE14286.1 2-isopropylmalate synthase [Candidatus Prometheoarchaeum syntrophicum]
MEKTKKAKYKFSKEELRDLLYDFNKEKGALPSDRPREVSIWDETLRDGEQTPGVFLTLDEKIKIATFLDEIGTGKIAAGFPAISPSELDIVKNISNLGLSNSTILGIARPKESDINACLKCDLNEIVLFMPISDLHLKIMNFSREQQIEMIQKAFDCAKDHGLKFNWVSEDGTRAQPEHLLEIQQLAIDNKASSIILGDTVGILQPETTIYMIEKMKKELKRWDRTKTQLGIHTHNDFGQAVSNTLAAVYHGATLPHVCVNGYGERAGNASFEEVVTNLEGMGVSTGINLRKLTEMSHMVEEIFGLPLSAHKPIVGSNAFSHESGLHIHAIISHPMAYEPINPSLVGQKRKFYLGKFSGSSSILNAIETKLKGSNLDIPRESIKHILQDVKDLQEKSSKKDKKRSFKKIKELVRCIQSGINDDEFFAIVQKYAKKYLKNSWVYEDRDKK